MSLNVPKSLRELWQFQDQFGRAALDDIMATERRTPAIVSRGPLQADEWHFEEVEVRKPGAGELLVDMVASGVCHTDIMVGSAPANVAPSIFYPRVLGHEGSGYVKEIGPGITIAKPGDPVLLSYTYCNKCLVCKAGHLSNCTNFNHENIGGPFPTYSSTNQSKSEQISGVFFGQSSFSKLSIVKQTSVVNVKGLVKDDKELALFAPLGCGIQTGSATVVNAAQAQPTDVVCVLGLGGVGMSAVLGAAVSGCKIIIGIDKVESRLSLAKEMGATFTIDSSKLGDDKSLVQAIRDATQDGAGPTITVETTGAPPLIQAALEASRNHGKVLQVGSAPPNFKLEIPVFETMMRGIQWIGAVEGQVVAAEYIPKMIQWYREGRFPVEKMSKMMPAKDFKQALYEMHDGSTIKPILLW